MRNLTEFETQVHEERAKVFFTGTTALVKGQGLCYDRGYYTSASGEAVTDAWGKRDKAVKVPAYTVNNAFAGVASQAYAANANGQWIEIILPGSITQVVTQETAVTIGENTYLACNIANPTATYSGYWVKTTTGFQGRGMARVLQTVTAAGLILVELMDGLESGMVQTYTPAAAGGAITCTPTGVTYVSGSTVNDAHCTYTLPSGSLIGQEKYFEVTTTFGNSKDLVITGVFIQANDDSTAGTTLTLDTDGDLAYLVWTGDKWSIVHSTGAALS